MEVEQQEGLCLGWSLADTGSFVQLDAGTLWQNLKMELVKGDLPFWHGLSIVLGTIRHLPLLLFLAFTVF